MNEMKRLREGTDDPELKALLGAGRFSVGGVAGRWN